MAPFKYIRYIDKDSGLARVGHYQDDCDFIQPLSFFSGTAISSLYQVIEAGDQNIIAFGDPFPAKLIRKLPPIHGRDIMAVGKNYAEHAMEFNKSGYDSSDKIDQPSCPVIFTKRSTSIIAADEDILPHKGFTKTLDYEGEIGVIIGKPGFQISEDDAWDHVWGYTIINDVTARERQRDHKQFFLGKSPDTFCPMGPVAVAASSLPQTLQIQTRVNGELRQDATSDQLIFSIPTLIATIASAQTLQLGDVIATGTPAGVGIGMQEPKFLKPGDEVSVSVHGLGTLRNRIASEVAPNDTLKEVKRISHILKLNSARANRSHGLCQVDERHLSYSQSGNKNGRALICVHGIGGTKDYWGPLISNANLVSTHLLHVYDMAGHGLSPCSSLSSMDIPSMVAELEGVIQKVGSHTDLTLIAHSTGCLPALDFAISHPRRVSRLILLGPPPYPLLPSLKQSASRQACVARAHGMGGIVDTIVTSETSMHTRQTNPIGIAAIRLSLLSQDPEVYAKVCTAMVDGTETLDLGKVEAETLIIRGDEDNISSARVCEGMAAAIPNCKLHTLKKCGHWHIFEDVLQTQAAINNFLYPSDRPC